MNRTAKLIFSLSFVAPMCATMGFVAWYRGEYRLLAVFAAIAVILFGACSVLFLSKRRDASERLNITSAKPASNSVLIHIATFVFPVLFSAPDSSVCMGSELLRQAWVWFPQIFCLLIVAVCHMRMAGSYSVNPIIPLFFGYRVYEATDDTGVGLILLSKKRLKEAVGSVYATDLTEDVYIIR